MSRGYEQVRPAKPTPPPPASIYHARIHGVWPSGDAGHTQWLYWIALGHFDMNDPTHPSGLWVQDDNNDLNFYMALNLMEDSALRFSDSYSDRGACGGGRINFSAEPTGPGISTGNLFAQQAAGILATGNFIRFLWQHLCPGFFVVVTPRSIDSDGNKWYSIINAHCDVTDRFSTFTAPYGPFQF